jgi:serine/threonine protein kinase
MYLQYGIYNSPAPSTFVRSGPTGQPILPSQEVVRNYKLEECLTIVLKSEIGHGATGEVLRGTLEVEASACVQLDVAVKLAFASEQHNAIRNEYKMYHLLRKRGVTTSGITTPLGLFDDVEGDACALITPYVGIPLSEMPEFVLPISCRCSAMLYIIPIHFLTCLDREAVLVTLKGIHQADILHGDLRLDNILVANSGLTIIDFARSRVCYDQDAKNREYSQLRSLLGRHASRTDIS